MIAAAILEVLLTEEEVAEVGGLLGAERGDAVLQTLAPRYSVIQRERLAPALERL